MPVAVLASGSGSSSRDAYQALPRQLGNPLLIGEREVLMDVRQREPRNVDGLGIGVARNAELSAGGFQQVVVDDLVDACVRRGEPVPCWHTHHNERAAGL